jgi:orotate phosphoribosyltransferase
MDKKELKEALERTGAVKYGKFTLSSGRESDYYVDMKMAMTDPSVLKGIANEAAKHVKGAGKLAGMELGAVPFVVAVALKTGIPYLIVRKEKKEYGTGNRVEGKISKGDKVVILEDVTTTGGSSLKAVNAIRGAGGLVDKVVVVVDRQEGAEALLKKEGISLVPLITKADLGVKG